MKKWWLLIIYFAFLPKIYAVNDFSKDTINSHVLGKILSVDDFLKETIKLKHTDNKDFKFLIAELLSYSKKNKIKFLEAKAYHLYGSYYENSLQMDSSLINTGKALQIQLEIGDSIGLISTYFSFGNHYDIKGIADSSLHYYYKALNIAEKIKDSLKIGYAYMGIGNIQSANKQVENAKETYHNSLVYFKATSEIAMSWIYNNLGTIYVNQDSLDKAIVLYKKSLTIKKKNNDWYGILFTNDNLGELSLKQGKEPEEALNYFLTSIRMGRKVGVEKEQLAKSFLKAGKAYLLMGKYNLALNYQDSSLQVGMELNSLNLIAKNYFLKAKIYSALKDYKKANKSLNNYVLYNDSLLNEQSLEQVNQLAARYENEKKELEISNLEKDKKAQKAEIKQQEAENLLYSVGLGLAIILIVFVSIAFFQKRKANLFIKKQKDEIQAQKEIVEEKNREITDSITYAKRIQQSILPPQRVVRSYLPKSFILYLPKDIVSGDFYWMESFAEKSDSKTKNNNIVLFAAVDCTGHGVPGAMVSVICHNALNKAVQIHQLFTPADILNKAEELIQESFADMEENVNDGMDIALCSLNVESKELIFSGANNPLWIIRNNADEIEEIRATKQPIGGSRKKIPFVNNTVQLYPGDSFYIFSDGFADQFGGPKGKKFMTKNFKKTLLKIVNNTAVEQKKVLKQTFKEWKGSLEQIDDVCVIGVKI